jgi:hypothetical protein
MTTPNKQLYNSVYVLKGITDPGVLVSYYWMDHDNAVENGHVEESLFVAHNEKFGSRRAMNDVDKIG